MTETMPEYVAELQETRDAQAVIDLATAAAEPQELARGKRYSVVVPHGGRLAEIDTEYGLDAPQRRHGSALMFTGHSFADYINEFKQPGTALYANVETLTVVGVLNGHYQNTEAAELGIEPGATGWGDFLVSLQLRHTPEWTRWITADNRLGDQVAFAEHIELGLNEIHEPPAAVMLELAQTFEAKTNVQFRSANILSTGERELKFEEQIDTKAGRAGQIVVPKEFTLGLTPFEGCEPYKVMARLRYKIREGHLQIGYILDRPNEILQAAFNDVVGEIEGLTEVAAFRGNRPA